jgi:hypothetical protein
VSHQRCEHPPQRFGERDHGLLLDPGRNHELDGELASRILRRATLRAVHASERNPSVAHPLVRTVVHEPEPLPIHFLTGPGGELAMQQRPQRPPSSRRGDDRFGLAAEAAKADRSAANPTDVRTLAVLQSVSSPSFRKYAEHDVLLLSMVRGRVNGRPIARTVVRVALSRVVTVRADRGRIP